jgi:hypothetical protein
MPRRRSRPVIALAAASSFSMSLGVAGAGAADTKYPDCQAQWKERERRSLQCRQIVTRILFRRMWRPDFTFPENALTWRQGATARSLM